MNDPKTTTERWAASVAALAVDALLDAGLVAREQFEAAHAIVAEEIFVRLCLDDYPPPTADRRAGKIEPPSSNIEHAQPGAAMDREAR